MPISFSRIRRFSRSKFGLYQGVAFFAILMGLFSAASFDTALAARGGKLVLEPYPDTGGNTVSEPPPPRQQPQVRRQGFASGGGTPPLALVADVDENESLEQGEGAAAAGVVKTSGQPAVVRLFGTVEFRSPIKNLPKWERVRSSEKKKPSFTINGLDSNNERVAQRWSALKAEIKDAPLKDQVREVNKFFNQWPYKTDRDIWGVEDYWATPREFVQKSGDCEDYAISKYYALRDLGVPANLLRVAAIKDTIRNLGHAVLIVYMNGDAYVLDNLTNLVLSHKKLSHYAPQYTVNEDYLWRHVKPKYTPPGKK